ncbi:hypothetical protein B0H12DRAFT_1107526 [Mycena haematopus]|nr:hypothetical protein B0H12DRAFT_1107526 [Mycena haematopus]
MMSDPPAAMGPHPVDRTFILLWGVQFIAYTLDIALWGVAVVLVLQYFRTYYKKDPPLIRTVVATLLLVTTIHALFLAKNDYKDFVSLFGDFEGQDIIPYEANVMICAAFVVAFVAQLFYATRIWVLSRGDWRYVTPVVLLAILQLSFGIAQTAEVAIVHRYSKLESTVVTSTAQGAASAACDITITAILCYILRKSRTGIQRTDSVLEKMIIYAFNRGSVTSLMALLQLILFIAMPGTLVFTLFILPNCHVYVISVCSMLMSRETLRAELSGRDGFITTFALTQPSFSTRQDENDLSLESDVNVHVATSVIKWVDGSPRDEDEDLVKQHDAHKPSRSV